MDLILLIGIGAGDPDHLTLQAVKALARTDAIVLLDKDDEPARLRRALIAEHAPQAKLVQIEDPPRVRGEVEAWRRRRGDLVERAVREEPGTGAFLVWGDPSLYDGHIALVEDLRERGLAFEVEVIPGISAASALAAAHRVTLTRTGRPVTITTGRRLAEAQGDALVMLDGDQAFERLDDDAEIFWGAYLGTPHELLISGRVGDVREEISRVRAQARAERGWMFDTYLVRRCGS